MAWNGYTHAHSIDAVTEFESRSRYTHAHSVVTVTIPSQWTISCKEVISKLREVKLYLRSLNSKLGTNTVKPLIANYPKSCRIADKFRD